MTLIHGAGVDCPGPRMSHVFAALCGEPSQAVEEFEIVPDAAARRRLGPWRTLHGGAETGIDGLADAIELIGESSAPRNQHDSRDGREQLRVCSEMRSARSTNTEPRTLCAAAAAAATDSCAPESRARSADPGHRRPRDHSGSPDPPRGPSFASTHAPAAIGGQWRYLRWHRCAGAGSAHRPRFAEPTIPPAARRRRVSSSDGGRIEAIGIEQMPCKALE